MKPSGITSVQWRLFNLYFLVEHFIGVCLSKKFISGRRRSLFQKIAGNQDIANRGEVLSVFTIDYRNGENTFPDKNQLLSPID